MDEKIYQKNIETILKHRAFMLPCLNDQEEILPVEIIADQAQNGSPIVKVKKEGYLYSLNSQVNPELIADAWMENFRDCNQFHVFVVIGLSNGVFLERLAEKFPQNKMIVFEPSPEILRLWLSSRDVTKLLSNGNVYIGAGKEGLKLLPKYYQQFINYANHKLIQWQVLPGYPAIWDQLILQVYKEFLDAVSDCVVQRNTLLHFGRERTQKYLKNLHDLIRQYGVLELEQTFQKKNLLYRPAIIIAAGPSLDKNVDLLKDVKNKALLIATDSASRTLEKHEIQPDLVVTVDSNKLIRSLDSPMIQNLPMILETTANSRLFDFHRGLRFYAATGELYTKRLLAEVGKKIGYLDNGGSVANTAFSFAIDAGFRTIILIGQDLAYPNGKLHAEAFYQKQAENQLQNDKKYFEVEDIYGGKVLTEANMDGYRKWFEGKIREHNNLRIVDATEGGAKIHGTEITTLEKILKEICEDLEEIHWEEIFREVEPLLNAGEKEKIETLIAEFPDKMRKYKEKLQKGIAAYEDMDRLKQRGQESTKDFKKAYELVCKTNQWVESLPEAELLEMYGYEAYYEIEAQTMQVQENQEQEWNQVIKLGKASYQRLLDSISQFLEDYPLLLGEKDGGEFTFPK